MPQRWLRRLSSLALLVVLLGGQGLITSRAEAAAPVYRVERAATQPVSGSVELGLAGRYLVWIESGEGDAARLSGVDLTTNRRLPLPEPNGTPTQLAVSGVWASWIEYDARSNTAQLIAYNLEGQQRRVVSTAPADPDSPAIDSPTVVWRDFRTGQATIRALDLVTGDERLIAAGALNYGAPVVNRSTIAWDEFNDGSWDVAAHDLATGKTRLVAGGADDQVRPRLGHNLLVYEELLAAGGAPRLKLIDLSTGFTTTLVSNHFVTRASIAAGVVAWEDWRDGLAGIFVYDVERRSEQAVTRAEVARRPVLEGGAVAWANQTPFGSVISVARLRAVLPTERRDPPLQADPNVIYFQETGHSLGFGFKTYWQQHGGLPVFGFPLTDEFTERDPTTGRTRTIQFFERFLLEYDQSESDPAKQVKVARLGAEWLSGKEPPRSPAFTDTGEKRYFPETGHSLTGQFKKFWDNHDGLRLLGYPLSEPVEQDGKTVQYFERGRLEYDPAIDDAKQRVAPGLLGRDALVARGWLPGQEPAKRPAAAPPN